MASYPAIDRLAPVNLAFMSKFDFTKVPNITRNQPFDNVGIPTCNATNPTTYGQSGFCTWTCTQCIRSTDIATCTGQGQWGLTFDDGNELLI
jgi:hypothetical protein